MFFEKVRVKKLKEKIERMKRQDYHCARINENSANIKRLEKEITKATYTIENTKRLIDREYIDCHNMSMLERRIFKLELMARGMTELEAEEEANKVWGWNKNRVKID